MPLQCFLLFVSKFAFNETRNDLAKVFPKLLYEMFTPWAPNVVSLVEYTNYIFVNPIFTTVLPTKVNCGVKNFV